MAEPNPLEGYHLGDLEKAWIEHVFAIAIKAVIPVPYGYRIVHLMQRMLREILEPGLTSTFVPPKKNQD